MFTSTLFAQHSFLKQRETIPLHTWKFQKGIIYDAQRVDFNDTSWENVTIPHTYSMDAINNIGYYRGAAWYRTT